MRTLFTILAAIAIAASAGGAFAMGNDPAPSSSAKPADPAYANAKAMIEAKRYGEAIPLLQQVVAKDPKNADAYNLLGYATRKSGDPNGSLQYYTTALQIDPKHLGANEYHRRGLPDARQARSRPSSISPGSTSSACSAASNTAR